MREFIKTVDPLGNVCVAEKGDDIFCDRFGGYQVWRGQRISLMSFEAFGCNYPTNVEVARRWEREAKEAYSRLVGESDV